MRVLWVSVIIVLCDQLAKLAVLKTMVRSRSIPVIGDWLKLTYTENPGMAFGVEFGPPAMISILSIVATVVIVGYFYRVRNGYRPYRLSLALVLGGAVGNIVDRVAYGKLFYDMPLFQGRVVDFFHLDIWRGFLPDWIPLMGGKAVALFPIGNIADIAIIAGVVGIIWFQKRFHDQEMAALATASGAPETDTTALPPDASGEANAVTTEPADDAASGRADGPAVSPELP